MDAKFQAPINIKSVRVDIFNHLLTVDGNTYNLLQLHFHNPSEHEVGGELFPMEMHLVHSDVDGNLAVVGVLLAAGEEDNAAYAPLWKNAPLEAMEEAETIEGVSINAADLLPVDYSVFAYSGSLTTPPCSEDVRWMVLTIPVELSAEQIDTFATNLFEGTNRPVQALNDRNVV